MNDLKSIATCDLVEELSHREGIELIEIPPHEIQKFELEGPMVILKVID